MRFIPNSGHSFSPDDTLVLGANTRAFKAVFAGAQQKLKATFGMELVELASRAGREHERNADEEPDRDANASVIKKKGD